MSTLLRRLAVHFQIGVAGIAIGQRDHGAARRHRRAVHREIDHLVDCRRNWWSSRWWCPGSSVMREPPFDADGIGAGGFGRNGVGERVCAGAARPQDAEVADSVTYPGVVTSEPKLV